MKKIVFISITLLLTIISIQDAGAYLFRKTWYHYGSGYSEDINYGKKGSELGISYTQNINVYVMAEVYPNQGMSSSCTGLIKINTPNYIEVWADNRYSFFSPYVEDNLEISAGPNTQFHYWWQYCSNESGGRQYGELKISHLYF